MNASTHRPGGGCSSFGFGLGAGPGRAPRLAAGLPAAASGALASGDPLAERDSSTLLRRCGRPLAVHSVTTGTSSSPDAVVRAGDPGSGGRAALLRLAVGPLDSVGVRGRQRSSRRCRGRDRTAGSLVSMLLGTTTTARTPPYADCRSEIFMSYIFESRPTTAMPSRGASPRTLRSTPASALPSSSSIFCAGLVAEADAGVLDLDGDTGLHDDRGEVHLGGRRRIARRVVEEFGDGVDDRFDVDAVDGDVWRSSAARCGGTRGSGTSRRACTLNSGTGWGQLRPGRPPPSTAMESARRPISAVPWSMRSRSSKTSGLRPWSSSISRSSLYCWWTIAWTRRAMLTKERCGGVAQQLLVVDDLEHEAQQVPLRLGDVVLARVVAAEGAGHVPGVRAAVHAAEPGGQDVRAEAHELLVVGGDALFEVLGPAGELGAQVTGDATTAYGFARDGDHQQRRDAAAPADGGPGRARHHGDGGPGHRGHQYGGRQQHARVGKFTATGRRLNTHHVCPLRQIGWGVGEFVGETAWSNGIFGTFGNKRTNTPQLGALRASLVRPDQRRVIFSKHLKSPLRQEYARPHLHARDPFAHGA